MNHFYPPNGGVGNIPSSGGAARSSQQPGVRFGADNFNNMDGVVPPRRESGQVKVVKNKNKTVGFGGKVDVLSSLNEQQSSDITPLTPAGDKLPGGPPANI